MQLAYHFEGTRYSLLMCSALFLMGCLAAHPWYLVGMRIQYGRFHPPVQSGVLHREGYRNTLKGLLYIRENWGVRGFYRGFFPALFIYGAMNFEDLHRMVFSKVTLRCKRLYY